MMRVLINDIQDLTYRVDQKIEKHGLIGYNGSLRNGFQDETLPEINRTKLEEYEYNNMKIRAQALYQESMFLIRGFKNQSGYSQQQRIKGENKKYMLGSRKISLNDSSLEMMEAFYSESPSNLELKSESEIKTILDLIQQRLITTIRQFQKNKEKELKIVKMMRKKNQIEDGVKKRLNFKDGLAQGLKGRGDISSRSGTWGGSTEGAGMEYDNGDLGANIAGGKKRLEEMQSTIKTAKKKPERSQFSQRYSIKGESDDLMTTTVIAEGDLPKTTERNGSVVPSENVSDRGDLPFIFTCRALNNQEREIGQGFPEKKSGNSVDNSFQKQQGIKNFKVSPHRPVRQRQDQRKGIMETFNETDEGNLKLFHGPPGQKSRRNSMNQKISYITPMTASKQSSPNFSSQELVLKAEGDISKFSAQVISHKNSNQSTDYHQEEGKIVASKVQASTQLSSLETNKRFEMVEMQLKLIIDKLEGMEKSGKSSQKVLPKFLEKPQIQVQNNQNDDDQFRWRRNGYRQQQNGSQLKKHNPGTDESTLDGLDEQRDAFQGGPSYQREIKNGERTWLGKQEFERNNCSSYPYGEHPGCDVSQNNRRDNRRAGKSNYHSRARQESTSSEGPSIYCHRQRNNKTIQERAYKERRGSHSRSRSNSRNSSQLYCQNSESFNFQRQRGTSQTSSYQNYQQQLLYREDYELENSRMRSALDDSSFKIDDENRGIKSRPTQSDLLKTQQQQLFFKSTSKGYEVDSRNQRSRKTQNGTHPRSQSRHSSRSRGHGCPRYNEVLGNSETPRLPQMAVVSTNNVSEMPTTLNNSRNHPQREESWEQQAYMSRTNHSTSAAQMTIEEASRLTNEYVKHQMIEKYLGAEGAVDLTSSEEASFRPNQTITMDSMQEIDPFKAFRTVSADDTQDMLRERTLLCYQNQKRLMETSQHLRELRPSTGNSLLPMMELDDQNGTFYGSEASNYSRIFPGFTEAQMTNNRYDNNTSNGSGFRCEDERGPSLNDCSSTKIVLQNFADDDLSHNLTNVLSEVNQTISPHERNILMGHNVENDLDSSQATHDQNKGSLSQEETSHLKTGSERLNNPQNSSNYSREPVQGGRSLKGKRATQTRVPANNHHYYRKPLIQAEIFTTPPSSIYTHEVGNEIPYISKIIFNSKFSTTFPIQQATTTEMSSRMQKQENLLEGTLDGNHFTLKGKNEDKYEEIDVTKFVKLRADNGLIPSMPTGNECSTQSEIQRRCLKVGSISPDRPGKPGNLKKVSKTLDRNYEFNGQIRAQNASTSGNSNQRAQSNFLQAQIAHKKKLAKKRDCSFRKPKQRTHDISSVPNCTHEASFGTSDVQQRQEAYFSRFTANSKYKLHASTVMSDINSLEFEIYKVREERADLMTKFRKVLEQAKKMNSQLGRLTGDKNYRHMPQIVQQVLEQQIYQVRSAIMNFAKTYKFLTPEDKELRDSLIILHKKIQKASNLLDQSTLFESDTLANFIFGIYGLVDRSIFNFMKEIDLSMMQYRDILPIGLIQDHKKKKNYKKSKDSITETEKFSQVEDPEKSVQNNIDTKRIPERLRSEQKPSKKNIESLEMNPAIDESTIGREFYQKMRRIDSLINKSSEVIRVTEQQKGSIEDSQGTTMVGARRALITESSIQRTSSFNEQGETFDSTNNTLQIINEAEEHLKNKHAKVSRSDLEIIDCDNDGYSRKLIFAAKEDQSLESSAIDCTESRFVASCFEKGGRSQNEDHSPKMIFGGRSEEIGETQPMEELTNLNYIQTTSDDNTDLGELAADGTDQPVIITTDDLKSATRGDPSLMDSVEGVNTLKRSESVAMHLRIVLPSSTEGQATQEGIESTQGLKGADNTMIETSIHSSSPRQSQPVHSPSNGTTDHQRPLRYPSNSQGRRNPLSENIIGEKRTRIVGTIQGTTEDPENSTFRRDSFINLQEIETETNQKVCKSTLNGTNETPDCFLKSNENIKILIEEDREMHHNSTSAMQRRLDRPPRGFVASGAFDSKSKSRESDETFNRFLETVRLKSSSKKRREALKFKVSGFNSRARSIKYLGADLVALGLESGEVLFYELKNQKVISSGKVHKGAVTSMELVFCQPWQLETEPSNQIITPRMSNNSQIVIKDQISTKSKREDSSLQFEDTKHKDKRHLPQIPQLSELKINVQAKEPKKKIIRKMLATGGDLKDRSIIMWDLNTFEPLQKLYGHENHISSIIALSKNYAFVSSSTDCKIALWDTTSTIHCAQLFETIKSPIMGIDFNPKTKTLAAASIEGILLFWRLFFQDKVYQGFNVQHRFEIHGQMVRFSIPIHHPNYLVTLESDCRLRLYNLKKQRAVNEFLYGFEFRHFFLVENSKKELMVFGVDQNGSVVECGDERDLRVEKKVAREEMQFKCMAEIRECFNGANQLDLIKRADKVLTLSRADDLNYILMQEVGKGQ